MVSPPAPASSSPSDAPPPQDIAASDDTKITLALHRTGICIETDYGSTKYFIDFQTTKTTEVQSPLETPLGSLRAVGIIGCVELGPGYLVLITQQEKSFEHKGNTIWNIKKALVVPLKLILARDVFGAPDLGPSRESLSSESELSSLNKENQLGSSSCPSPLPTPLSTLTTQINRQKDMLFSKAGVYINDIKSNASLSLSNQRVNKLNYDELDDVSSNEEVPPDNSSFKLNRSITIKGAPKLGKQNKPLAFLERAKVRKYDSLYLDSHISSEMLLKFERQLERFYSTGDFYYSDQLDITREISFVNEQMTTAHDDTPNSFFFNEIITHNLPSQLRIPIIQGFVRALSVDLTQYEDIRQGQLLLISKRSTKRAGSRYLRRGIDDEGNVANFVLTSQFLIVDEYMPNRSLFTRFDILRGSIPIFFQQDPSKLKPVPYLTRPVEKCETPFIKHFEGLKESYGDVACINLVEKSKKEAVIGDTYQTLCEKNGVVLDWFDFHDVCKKMKFGNVVKLLDEKLEFGQRSMTVEQYLVECGWVDSLCEKTQTGVLRVNCVDCLDRTNLVQKFLSEFILEKYILQKYCLVVPPEFQHQYNNLWADNGDFISRQYSSTNALKGDYTRTAKRNYKGLFTDAYLTLSRYYSGYISDYFKQCFIDYLLGHQKESIFEEFESTLNVLDPNEISENLNKKNSTLQQIIEQMNFDNELILIGSWPGFTSPMAPNVLKVKNGLRTVSFFITSKKLFIVDFDDNKSEIRQTVVIDIADIKHLEYGTYILSTHNSISSNPKRNVGLKIFTDKGTRATAVSPSASPNPNPRRSLDSMHEFDDAGKYDYFTIKFPQDMDYTKVKYIIDLLSKTCHSSTLENRDIMTSTEASANVFGLLEHRFKKMVWG